MDGGGAAEFGEEVAAALQVYARDLGEAAEDTVDCGFGGGPVGQGGGGVDVRVWGEVGGHGCLILFESFWC